MKDLSDRFAHGEGERQAEARPDPLARLHQPSPGDEEPGGELRHWFEQVRGRADLLAALCASLAAGLVLWPLVYPSVVQLPAVAETSDEVATLTVQPLSSGGVTSAPDWDELFNAYQLETTLRDISIRCNYALPADAHVDRYLHARLLAGTAIRIFLADPATCPRL